jgi:hypothetical protein
METVETQPSHFYERLDKGSQAEDALGGIEFPRPSLSLRVLHRLRLHRLPLLYGCLLEVRNLLRRIVRLHRTRLYRRSLDIGPAFERAPDGSYRECVRTHACSAGMRNLYATRPGLTILDAELFLAGWKRGSEWARGTTDTRTPDRSPASFTAPESVNPTSHESAHLLSADTVARPFEGTLP